MADVGVYKTDGEGGWFFLVFETRDGSHSHLIRAEEADILAQNIRRRLEGRATLSMREEEE